MDDLVTFYSFKRIYLQKPLLIVFIDILLSIKNRVIFLRFSIYTLYGSHFCNYTVVNNIKIRLEQTAIVMGFYIASDIVNKQK